MTTHTKSRSLKAIRNHPQFNQVTLSIVAAFLIIGGYYILSSLAATGPFLALQAGNATATGGATSTTDSTASNGKSLTFGSASSGSGPTIKISGTKFVDAAGNQIQLRGVNRPSLESSCTQRGDVFMTSPWSVGMGGAIQGNTTAYVDTVAKSLLTWDKAGTAQTGAHAINAVRIPLHEACWLGNGSGTGANVLSGLPDAFSGENYKKFVVALVDALRAQNMYVILDDHWGAPGTWLQGTGDGKTIGTNAQNGQTPAANQDHSLTFWADVAGRFKSYNNVMFDIENEPDLFCRAGGTCPASIVNATGYGGDLAREDWALTLYRDGGDYTFTNPNGYYVESKNLGKTWKVAGTSQIVRAIRDTGKSCAPIAVSTLGGGSGYIDMLGAYMPADLATTDCPLGNQVAVTFHSYDYSGFNFGGFGSYTSLLYDLDNGKEFVPPNSFKNSAAVSISNKYPVYVGEWGSSACPVDTTYTLINYKKDVNGNNVIDPANSLTARQFNNNSMDNMGKRKYSWTAWGWDSGEVGDGKCGGPGLVGPQISNANDTGTTTEYGALVKTFLQATQGQP